MPVKAENDSRASGLKKRLIIFCVCLLAILPAVTLSACINEKSYTEKVWDDNFDTYQNILNLPFNRGVSDGTLDARIFRDYIIQDFFYLQNFKKVYETLLSKAPDDRGKEVIEDIIGGIDEEIESVHRIYFQKYNVSNQELLGSTPNPTTDTYNSYLMKTATQEPFEVGLIATLPCHWIYYQVGVDMKKEKQVEGNPYHEWIDEYGTIPWEKSDTKVVVDLVEYYMEKTTEKTRKKMEQAYKKAVGLEYMFWDTVYKEFNNKGTSMPDSRISPPGSSATRCIFRRGIDCLRPSPEMVM
ncbi:MAG: TenA family protein [Actinobacteria bacterium]|nr:TenA family protein [Actinomycetota bacterium]MCG2819980.1 TenA family protein [Actinomycetes bacterium]MBU4179121.1 TenA family protein [Actinomycetota bacterium]MBU4219629.1 TenA family protein [Actinomycetota bacterium]MBU4357743.1 TenA family protein [Actinomycetota bacterium]